MSLRNQHLQPTKLTRDVSRLLNANPVTLVNLIRIGRLDAPAKDCSGRYVWTDTDIERARIAMTTDRRRKEHRQVKVQP